MNRSLFTVTFAVMFCLAALAQTATAQRVVRASGQASISAQPDQARVSVGVITKGPTAEEASSKNARQVEAVLIQLRQMLGSGARIKTINYSLTPDYRRTAGEPPVLVGFTASNTIEVTIENLALIGTVIDSATQAGATNVHGLRFTLKDPEPLRAQVLGLAAKQARAHAEAIATGLDQRIGNVLVAQEGAVIGILSPELRDVAGAAATPIEPGLVEVRATVTVEVELL
ncbi:MAG: SIMPL domain-containing protein [bacterium]|nr:SIMPL domain-containing protein [bacterium]